MKNVVGLLLKAGITMALVACAGQSSDPLKDYKDVKAVPAHEQRSEGKTADVPLIRLEVDGGNEMNFGSFNVGKAGHVDVKVRSQGAANKIQTIDDVSISDFSGSDQPTWSKSGDTVRVFWTPKSTVIPDGKSSARKDFDLTVVATVAGRQTAETIRLTFTVDRDVLSPVIKGVNGLSGTKSEGEKVEFTVDVEDPNANNGGAAPEVFAKVLFNTNTEAYNAGAAAYVTANEKISQNPARTGNVYRFYLVLHLDKLPPTKDRKGAVDDNAGQVEMCLNIGAESIVAQKTAGTKQVCLTGKYSAQPAKIAFEDNNTKVTAGVENTIRFKVSTENSLSALSVNNAQVNNLVGTKKLECTPNDDSKTLLNCAITWTPTCNAKLNTNSALVKLVAQSSLNGSKAKNSETAQRQYEIDNSACEAQAKAKAEADAKAKEEAAKLAAEKKAADEKAKAEAAAARKLAQEEAAAKKKAEQEAAKQAREEAKKKAAEEAAAKKASTAAAQADKPKAQSSAATNAAKSVAKPQTAQSEKKP